MKAFCATPGESASASASASMEQQSGERGEGVKCLYWVSQVKRWNLTPADFGNKARRHLLDTFVYNRSLVTSNVAIWHQRERERENFSHPKAPEEQSEMRSNNNPI